MISLESEEGGKKVTVINRTENNHLLSLDSQIKTLQLSLKSHSKELQLSLKRESEDYHCTQKTETDLQLSVTSEK